MSTPIIKWSAEPTQDYLLTEAVDPSFRWTGQIGWSDLPQLVREWDWIVHHRRSGRSDLVSHLQLDGRWSHCPTDAEVIGYLQELAEAWQLVHALVESTKAAAMVAMQERGPESIEIRSLNYPYTAAVHLDWPDYADLGLGESVQHIRDLNRDLMLPDICDLMTQDKDFIDAVYVLREEALERDRERIKEIDRQKAAKEEEEEKRAAEQAARRQKLIADLLANDKIGQKQFAEGLMLERDQRDLLREHYWPEAAADLIRFKRLVFSDLECDCILSPDEQGPSCFDSEVYTGPLSREEYSVLNGFRALFGDDFDYQVVDHTLTCPCCEEMVSRFSLRVSIEIEGWTLSRHYALG